MRPDSGPARAKILHNLRDKPASLHCISGDISTYLRVLVEQHGAQIFINSSSVVPEGLTNEWTRPVPDEFTRKVKLSAFGLYVCVKISSGQLAQCCRDALGQELVLYRLRHATSMTNRVQTCDLGTSGARVRWR